MYKRNCPKCQKELIHSSEKSCDRANNEKVLCRTCSKRKYDDNVYENLIRNCPNCSEIIYYSRFSDKKIAIDNNSFCKKCSLNSGKLKKGHNLNDTYNISNNSLKNLLQETYESFYWLGFIIADGSFGDNNFELSLAKKDLDHLLKFSKFIEFDKKLEFRKKSKSYRMSFSDRFSVNKVKDKYDLKKRKTYNPVRFNVISNYDNNLLLCLLIGIIDGDGYIGANGSKNSRTISIVSHKKWKNFYQKLIAKIGINDFFIKDVKNTNKITVKLYKRESILFLFKDIAIKFNLPFLERKWNKIPLVDL